MICELNPGKKEEMKLIYSANCFVYQVWFIGVTNHTVLLESMGLFHITGKKYERDDILKLREFCSSDCAKTVVPIIFLFCFSGSTC